ncbi:unnamed protein product [Arabidopsis thaliana]|uniref:(thale cress) hypothetical protein n=1 Tax=Arabidopsis thaliana TaxID=3702 RepID=A0A7G2E6Y3_ARATH|nr:unnamed protein product [Arabidopsis thaliana]
MSMDLDQAIQEMSIKDEEPLVLSNQAQFCSIERNTCSILGRFLNSSNQRMSNWILDMPRIWRLYSRVRGVALSQERFQFFFKSEDDLLEILKTGVWTQDEWCVVMERWIEKPTEEYLMFLPVELDLEKSQAQDYIRVQVIIDVRNPLRNFKEVQLPTGEIVSVTFDYERIRKRCFLCQRLTHEKGDCDSGRPGKSSVMDGFQRSFFEKKEDKEKSDLRFPLPSSDLDRIEGNSALSTKTNLLNSRIMSSTPSEVQSTGLVEKIRKEAKESQEHEKAYQEDCSKGIILDLDLDLDQGFNSALNEACSSA